MECSTTRPRSSPVANASRRPRIVIVGAGFGGLAVKIPPAPFRHRNFGNLAPIGRKGRSPIMANPNSGTRRIGIAALVLKPRTSTPAPGQEIYAYLLRDMVIDTGDRSGTANEWPGLTPERAESPVLWPGLKDDTEAAATGRGYRDRLRPLQWREPERP